MHLYFRKHSGLLSNERGNLRVKLSESVSIRMLCFHVKIELPVQTWNKHDLLVSNMQHSSMKTLLEPTFLCSFELADLKFGEITVRMNRIV